MYSVVKGDCAVQMPFYWLSYKWPYTWPPIQVNDQKVGEGKVSDETLVAAPLLLMMLRG